ncbi:hypothetical protein [Roseivivax sp. CAU 1761]
MNLFERLLIRWSRPEIPAGTATGHVHVSPGALDSEAVAQALKAAIERAYGGSNWAVVDVRGENYQSHSLNSICMRHRHAGPNSRRPLVITDRRWSAQFSIDLGRARDCGVVVVVARNRPRQISAERAWYHFCALELPLEATLLKRGRFHITESKPAKPPWRRPYPRARCNCGRGFDIGLHEYDAR